MRLSIICVYRVKLEYIFNQCLFTFDMFVPLARRLGQMQRDWNWNQMHSQFKVFSESLQMIVKCQSIRMVLAATPHNRPFNFGRNRQ